MIYYNVAQTFTISSESVQGASEVAISSVELYFKGTPTIYTLGAGTPGEPGVTVGIVPTNSDGSPSTTNIGSNKTRLEYHQVRPNFTMDASTPTKFIFDKKVLVKTNKFYAIYVKFDNSSYYDLWKAVANDVRVGTNTVIAGAVNSPGSIYRVTDSSTTTPKAIISEDLKFKVNVLKWNDTTNALVRTKNHEFFFINENTSTLNFSKDELVYQEKADETGTVSVSNSSVTVTGTSTEFTSFYEGALTRKEYVLITSGSDKVLREVISVTSNTVLTIDNPPPFTNTAATYAPVPVGSFYNINEYRRLGLKKSLITLYKSNADENLKFEDGGTLYGTQSNSIASNPYVTSIALKRINPKIDLVQMDGTDFDANVVFNYYQSGSNTETQLDNYYKEDDIAFYKDYDIPAEYKVVLPSRSNEITLNTGDPITQSWQSNSVLLNYSTERLNPFAVATVANGLNKLQAVNFHINNDATNENTRQGNAFSKHISKVIKIDSGLTAEDIKVYLTMYRPPGTSIKVYSKLWNNFDSEPFVDKDWSEHRNLTNSTKYSNGKNDLIECMYSLYAYPRINATLDGVVEVQSGNTVVTGVATTFSTDLVAGDLIKIYPTLFPDNYSIVPVASVDSDTEITVSTEITNADLFSGGLKIDKILYKKEAFLNSENDNIVKYYNNLMVPFNGFNQYCIKIVFLSESRYIVPYINDIRVVAVST